MAQTRRSGRGTSEEAPGSSFRIHLLGDLSVQADGDQERAIGSARARSLLGYLIVHDGLAQSRQRLAFLLWPDSTEAQARTNLRNVLHVLRRACPELEDFVEAGTTTLQWRGGDSCWVDLVALRSSLARADGAARGSEREVAALREAVALYRGDLLEGCYDEWAVEERERLRDLYVAALRKLVESLLVQGDLAEAMRLGREVVRRDPLGEAGYRQLMLVHDTAGDRAGAMRVYHECVTILRSELGVEPAAATRDMYAELTQGDSDAERRALPTTGADLVGRGAEWTALTRCWTDAEHGEPHLVVITGEPGVGKTRLAEELAAWCAHRGAVVGRARCYPTEGDLGYGVVLSWLRTTEQAEALRRLPAAEVAELARLLPELGAARATPSGTSDGADRLRLFGSVVHALTATGRPVLLIVDDAQWSDAPSLLLLHYLLRQPAMSPVVVVVTVRPEDLDAQHPLVAVTEGLQLIDRVTEVPLERLTREDTIELARHLSDDDLDEAAADALYVDTEGNPLFVVETIRAGAWAGGERISPKLQAVIAARIRQLSAPAQRMLGVAATIGRAFTADLIAEADDVDEMSLVHGLDELWQRGLIREHDGDAYDFSHGRIRDVAYGSLSPAARRRNHRRVAAALIVLHPDDVEAVSGQVAANLEHAGQVEEASAWYQRAAREAHRLSADSEAVRLLERARTLTGQLPGRAARLQELSVLSLLATALGGADSFTSQHQVTVQQRAVELAALLDVELDPPLLRTLVMTSLCHNDFDEARGAAERLARSAEQDGDEGLAVESRYLLGIASFWACDLPAAGDLFREVIERFRPDQRTEHVLRFGQDPQVVCLSRLANTLWFLGHDDDARAACHQALGQAAHTNHPFSVNVVNVFAAVLAVDLADHDAVAGYAAALSRDRDRSRVFEVNAEAMVGYAEAVAGQPEGVARILRAIDALGTPNPMPAARSMLMRVLVGAYAIAGGAEAALDAADAALSIGGTRLWEPEIRRLRAELLARSGRDRSDIEAELDRAAHVAARCGARGPARLVEETRARLLDHP